MRRFFSVLLLLVSAMMSFAQSQQEALQKLHERNRFFDLSTEEHRKIVSGMVVLAVGGHDTTLVSLYLEAGFPIEQPDQYGETCLQEATAFPQSIVYQLPPYSTHDYSQNDLAMIRLLLRHGADPNHFGNSDYTPLMQTVIAGDTTATGLLLRAGGKPELKNKSGKTAFDLGGDFGRDALQKQLVLAQTVPQERFRLFAYRASQWAGLLALVLLVLAFVYARGAWKKQHNPYAPVVSSSRTTYKLDPLQCPNCGQGVPLRLTNMKCLACGTPVPVPAAYSEVMHLREVTQKKLQAAIASWRKAKLKSHVLVQIFFVLAGLTVLFLGIAGNTGNVGVAMHPREHQWAIFDLGKHPDGFLLLNLLSCLIVAIGFLYYAQLLFKTNRLLPHAPKLNAASGQITTEQCRACGGVVEFLPGAVAACCGYCGTDMLTAEIVAKEKRRSGSDVAHVNTSLLMLMHQHAELRRGGWGALQRPLLGLLGLLASTGAWMIWGITENNMFLSIGWILMLPAMIFLAWSFATSFEMPFWRLALLLIAFLVYYGWAVLLSGFVGAFVATIVLVLALPVVLTFVAIFRK